MNALQKTLAMIAFLILVSQTIRHAYLLWLEPRGSALDKYDQPLKTEITKAATLEELVQRYDAAHKRVEDSKQGGKSVAGVSYLGTNQNDLYVSEGELRQAIVDWEAKAKEIRALRLYWLAGLGFLGLGVVAYRKLSRWFGLSLVTAGFSEFIYWTSPAFLGASTREFDRLLVNKLVFSLLSLLLLLIVIWRQRIFADTVEKTI